MKDQRRLASRCLENDIPFFTLCGTDILAICTLEYYYLQAKGIGCDRAFLEDLKLLIDDFKAYAKEEVKTVKKPD